ncbi:factor-independent urate hydroxylase [Micromonospora sp. KLBMP9576]|uniref:factor-independent urate hydroxylase n=1 Tax=Micromonospora sp. KLBMP9576 TaxID=3424769 RepID=UPI003D8BEC10
MSTFLTDHQYGKQSVRLVHVDRGADRHRLCDLTVDVTLTGDMADSYHSGDNSKVLATDSQKNTVYAFARQFGVANPEALGLRLARHFVDSQPAVSRARVGLVWHGWQPTDDCHSFRRVGAEHRTVTITHDGERSWLVGGVSGLTLLKTTGSEFRGYPRDPYTTLPEAADRLLATTVQARWRYASAEPDAAWDDDFRSARSALIDAFASTHSRSLQQTLHAMACGVLDAVPSIVEVRLALPNKHHLLVDLTAFQLDNPAAVYVATEEPYGLIEGTVARTGAGDPGLAWW